MKRTRKISPSEIINPLYHFMNREKEVTLFPYFISPIFGKYLLVWTASLAPCTAFLPSCARLCSSRLRCKVDLYPTGGIQPDNADKFLQFE